MHSALPVRRRHGEGSAELVSPGSRQQAWETFNAALGRFIQDIKEHFFVESLEQFLERQSYPRPGSA